MVVYKAETLTPKQPVNMNRPGWNTAFNVMRHCFRIAWPGMSIKYNGPPPRKFRMDGGAHRIMPNLINCQVPIIGLSKAVISINLWVGLSMGDATVHCQIQLAVRWLYHRYGINSLFVVIH